MNVPKIGLVLLAGLLLGADDPKTNTDGDKAIEGVWVVKEAERGGNPSDSALGDRLAFRDGQVTIEPDEEGARREEATYTLDTSKVPGQIDFKPKPRSDQGQEPPVLLGIFKVEGDTLTIVLAAPGEDRPSEFKSADGTKTLKAVMTRQAE